VKDGAAILHELFAVKDAVYWHASEAGVSQLLKADANSGNISAIVLPLRGHVSEMSLEPASGQLSFILQSASVAPARYRLGKDGQLASVLPAGTAPQPTAGILSKTFYLASANGERIPLTLIYHAGLEMDGSHPALLVTDYAAPSFFAPGFDASRMAWLEQGGIVAIAQMRSATNDVDRKAARLAKYTAADNKNDQSAKVILAAEYLIKEAYTSPGKLAAEELDSGKDVVIKAALRRPDLFAAVHVHNVRSEALPTADEKITPKKNRTIAGEAAFAFDELRSGVAYPAVLISADATETGAPLWMSAKLAAGMQILSANKNRPVLLRTSAKRSDAEMQAAQSAQSERADAWAFLLWQAGVKKFSLIGGK
jgi:prolyl oligopeptidase